jgi:hypothetical protein
MFDVPQQQYIIVLVLENAGSVSRVPKPAAATHGVRSADLEVGDTAGLEACATQ